MASKIQERRYTIVERRAGSLLVRVTVGRDEALYEVRPAGGHAWLAIRDGQEPHRVSLDPADSCDCDGFRFRRKCRHCDLLRRLLEQGHLREPVAMACVAGPTSYEWDD